MPRDQQCYQWLDRDGTTQIGRKAYDVDDEPICTHCFMLMSRHHTGELEWVDGTALTPYPATPIEEPSK